jgi:hypothetical protein
MTPLGVLRLLPFRRCRRLTAANTHAGSPIDAVVSAMRGLRDFSSDLELQAWEAGRTAPCNLQALVARCGSQHGLTRGLMLAVLGIVPAAVLADAYLGGASGDSVAIASTVGCFIPSLALPPLSVADFSGASDVAADDLCNLVAACGSTLTYLEASQHTNAATHAGVDFSAATALRELVLSIRSLLHTPASIASLAGLTSLRSLTVTLWYECPLRHVTAVLATLPHLQAVDLTSFISLAGEETDAARQRGDAVWAGATPLPHVRSFTMHNPSNGGATCAGLFAYCARLPKLEALAITSCALTETLFGDLLSEDSACRGRLRNLSLAHSSVTTGGGKLRQIARAFGSFGAGGGGAGGQAESATPLYPALESVNLSHCTRLNLEALRLLGEFTAGGRLRVVKILHVGWDRSEDHHHMHNMQGLPPHVTVVRSPQQKRPRQR